MNYVVGLGLSSSHITATCRPDSPSFFPLSESATAKANETELQPIADEFTIELLAFNDFARYKA